MPDVHEFVIISIFCHGDIALSSTRITPNISWDGSPDTPSSQHRSDPSARWTKDLPSGVRRKGGPTAQIGTFRHTPDMNNKPVGGRVAEDTNRDHGRVVYYHTTDVITIEIDACLLVS